MYALMHTRIVKNLYFNVLEKINNHDSAWYTTDIDIVDEKLSIKTFRLFLIGGQMIFDIGLLYSILSQVYSAWLMMFVIPIAYVFIFVFRPIWQKNHYDLSIKRNEIINNWNDIAEGIDIIQSSQCNISYFRNRHQKGISNLQKAGTRRINLSRSINLWIRISSLVAIYGVLFLKLLREDYKYMIVVLVYGQNARQHLISFIKAFVEIEANLCYVDRIKRQMRFTTSSSKISQSSASLSTITTTATIKQYSPMIEIFNDNKTIGNDNYNDGDDGIVKFVEIINLSLEYCKIKNFTLSLCKGRKVAITGRTGIGKTSLIMVLAGLEKSYRGNVNINGTCISNMDLSDVLSFVPQNLMIWSGTVRFNIDPTNAFSDGQIWTILEELTLAPFIRNLELSLEATIIMTFNSTREELECSNWTRSNLQLLCLARALIRSKPLLLLDEATANLDADLDCKINRILVNRKDLTIVCISHKPESIRGFDEIIEIK